jgi:hypothetical protein
MCVLNVIGEMLDKGGKQGVHLYPVGCQLQ